MTHKDDSEDLSLFKEDKQEDTESLGNRIKKARLLTSLERPAFCERYGFVYRTYQRWELGTQIPPLDSLENFCAALLQEGIVCDVSWLLTGEGIAPYKKQDKAYQTHLQVIDQEDIHEFKFLKRFGTSYDTIVRQIRGLFTKFEDEDVDLLRVRDQALSPFLNTGDFLIVRWQDKDLESPDDKVCVIQIEQGINIVRCVSQTNKQFMLSALNDSYKPLFTSLPVVWGKILCVMKAP